MQEDRIKLKQNVHLIYISTILTILIQFKIGIKWKK